MGTKIVRPYHFMGGRNSIFLKRNIKRFQVYISASKTSQTQEKLNRKNPDIFLRDLSRVALGNSTPESWNAFSQV